MRQTRLIALAAACATIAVAMSISRHIVHGQTVYNPYPTGILPSNIDPEIARVLREVNSIEAEAIRQWQALPPPVVTGNPPTLQNTGVASVEILGKLMNFDRTISPNENEACSSCHMPYAGYSGPIPSVNLTMIAYPGSVHFRAGKRTAQRYTYASYFPPLQYDAVQGLFYGGNFWDSRATGYLLRSPDAEQSQGPPVDPDEMGNPDTACVTYKLSLAPYRPLFELIWGSGSFDITWPANIAQICATPNGASVFNGNPTPVALSPADRTRSNNDYDHWAQSLNAFEHSESVSPFTSKFDAYLKGTYKLTAKEAAGYALFRGKGNCNSCHLDGRSTAPAPTNTGAKDTGVAANVVPVFTCFGSANEGLPKNPRDSFYYETTPDAVGFTPNPGGFTYTDFGLGTFLRSGFGSAPNPNSSWRQFASTVDGQMQVMTARNVGLTPPSCPTTEAPGPYFQKEFFHNGYIKSLKQLVHFYNTRDLYRNAVESGNCPTGTTEKVNCWPEPEVPQNIDMTTGNLGLTDTEENEIVAFLQTLSDGFTTPYPDVNTYTGACMTGGTAATQGNSTIIPADLLRQFQQMQR
ncbi:cytochrome-c peroxidase [Tunturiibacter gelidoferens]|uniref:Cytochrome c peroxidase n=1 Tax=Tunturiibacter gelidiferens TaxID=3069689 RepID=A0AAU7YVT0_9BACT